MHHNDGKPNHRGTNVPSKTEATIARLSELLSATEAAEELSDTWHRTPGRSDGPRLSDLRTVLNSGRTISHGERGERGIPMWIVVRMCKAAWHNDGTWPLLGCDEELPRDATERLATMQADDQQATQNALRPRSVHPAKALLRPANVDRFELRPAPPAYDGPPIRPESTADQIAEAYRARGSHVPHAAHTVKDDDW